MNKRTFSLEVKSKATATLSFFPAGKVESFPAHDKNAVEWPYYVWKIQPPDLLVNWCC